MPTFEQNFQPERGDFLYGIRDTRTDYLKDWEAQAKTTDISKLVKFLTLSDSGSKANWNIIDNFNDYFFLGGHVTFGKGGDARKVPHQLYARLRNVEKTISKEYGDDVMVNQVEQRSAYVNDLMRSRYSPATVFNTPKAKVKAEGFTKKLAGSKESARVQNQSYLAIRRACKFGIGLAATSPAFKDITVHFLLDGLNLAEVAQKQQRVGYGGRTSVSITTSEVRYVYRNWAALRNKVKFYVNLNEVNPPWEDDWSLATLNGVTPNPIRAERDLWTAYGQHRSAKYSGAVPTKPLI